MLCSSIFISDISTLPLVKSPRSVWKGREIPEWFLKNNKKAQLDHKITPVPIAPCPTKVVELVQDPENTGPSQPATRARRKPLQPKSQNHSHNQAKCSDDIRTGKPSNLMAPNIINPESLPVVNGVRPIVMVSELLGLTPFLMKPAPSAHCLPDC